MMKRILFVVLMMHLFSNAQVVHHELFIEAESFKEKGGWLVDPQFVEQMGSPYLLAHGLGKPVRNASTEVTFDKKGTYHMWVRTMDWAPGNWASPGRFKIVINKRVLETELGTSPGWHWQYAGNIDITKKKNQIEFKDLTGFNGRCDAIYFSMENLPPPNDKEILKKWRLEKLEIKPFPEKNMKFDLVVVGGGLAGCAAAITAAEQGLKVALVHDRPVLGGNASGEIRVHTLGIYGHFERVLKMLDTEHYPNGSPQAYEEDKKRMEYVKKYKNIHLFLNWRAYDAHAENDQIKYVDARQTNTGERMRLQSDFFVDSTGDGWIGFWSGAEYVYGRESVDTYDESWEKYGEIWSPDVEDNFVMGASVLWRTEELDVSSYFPKVPWALEVSNSFAANKGTWNWEFSRNDLHQIHDAEKIRDHMLKAIFGSFYNEKEKEDKDNLSLKWVSYLVGKRESRRLVGDHIFTLNDARLERKFQDSVVVEIREIDVHYQQNLLDPNKPDFLSEALFYHTGKYYVPYRSLYSKNISNLFMAGRCFSCSHVGLGGPRVMRTTGQMGAAVGYAASICNKYDITPREVYQKHLKEYMSLVLNSNHIP